MAHGSTLRFDRFEISPAERTLVVDGVVVQVGSRAFDLLMALTERRDRVVSKNELLDLAWPGLVVEENNLSVQISSLRKLLGPLSITTVAGRGYRLTASELGQARASVAGTPDESPDRIQRRLGAVACADIMNWEQSLQADASGSIAAWKFIRTSLLDNLVLVYGGKTLDASTQGVLLECPSAVDATRWALDLQGRFALRDDARMGTLQLRVSLGVDDAIVDDGRLVGEGVQATARRLLRIGPGQIVTDHIVRSLVCRRLPVSFEKLNGAVGTGEDAIDAGYLLQAKRTSADHSTKALKWGALPGIAVLPFQTDDANLDPYFGDGMTEEIITALSVNRVLLVIARASALHYRASTRPPSEIASELGVRYLLVGTVRRSQQRLRILAELMDAESQRAIWSERYEGAEEDIFAFQVRIASSIAAAIDPRVQEAEIARAVARPTGSLSAYDCVLRGLSVLYSFRRGDFELAGEHFRRAITLDAQYAQAHAHLAWWHNLRIGEGRSPEMSDDALAAEQHSRLAVELDQRDAWALSVAGHIQSFVRKNFRVAMDMFDQALAINPSCATAWSRSGTTLAYMGDGEQALERVRNAMRLSPFDQQAFAFCTTNGTASLVAGHLEDSVAWLGKARRLNPGYRAASRNLIAALALSGEVDEARAQAQEYLLGDPAFRVSVFGGWYPLRDPHLGRLLAGLRLAGLPD